MNEEEQLQIHDVGREGTPEPASAEPDELRVPDDLEAYFRRVETEKGERAAAEAALAEAERMAAAQADRSMHVADSSKETVNGALSRIGGDLSQGKDAQVALDEAKEQIVRLRTEERAALAALRADLPPTNVPVAEEPASAGVSATEVVTPESTAPSPSDAWTADERRDVSAYLDSIDATDKAHAAYMKSVREMKKIDKGSDAWSKKAGEVNGLEQRWKDAKATSRALEDKLGPRSGELAALDVGRKAGRDALRARMDAAPAAAVAESEPAPEAPIETAPAEPEPPAAPEAVEPDPSAALAMAYTEPEAMIASQPDTAAAADTVPLIHVRDYLPTAAQWKSEESYVRDMTADELLERVERSERNYRDSVLDASRRPDTVEEQERNELAYWKWKNETWRELADRKRAAEAAHVSMQEGLATRTPEKMREDAAEDIRWSDAVITGLNEALQERELSGFNSLTPTSGEMIADIPVDSPLTTPRGDEPPPTPERGVRAKIDAYRMLVDVMAQTDPYRRPENGTLHDDPDSLMRLVRVFQEAPRLLETIPNADAPHLARALREVAVARGVHGADAMSDASIRSWAERLTEDTTYALNEKAEKMYSW